MSDFMVPTSASTPLRPNLPSRVLLGLIRWQERRKKRLSKRGVGQNNSAQGQGGAQVQSVVALPEQQHFLKILRKAMDTPSFPQRLSAMPLRRVVHVQVPGATGPLAARLYIPHGRVRGAVLYLHGGGFVHCGLNSHHGICCRLARASGAAVLLPDYALAPENPFPAAVEDSRAALVWLAGASAQYWG
ncbi:alpha/beta hydrolase fold domain-containing protein, partial [Acetobacter sp.]|uniref:alpha/beta hydrolase fold domain-containing protein n=1 Tax=Acetobacter sp. TaxID=440 RepID=UPI0039E87392